MCDIKTTITHENDALPTRSCSKHLFCFVWLLLTAYCTSARQNEEQHLYQQYAQARSDSERIVLLDKLSDYFYAHKNESKGDSLIEQQIMLAEASRKPNLIVQALFNNSMYKSMDLLYKTRSDKAQKYIGRALAYAINHGLTDYAALAYANMANRLCLDGKIEEAFKYANLGFSNAFNSANDSVKIICALQLGNVLMQKAEVLMAFKTYTNAYDIAIGLKQKNLLSMVYRCMSALYKKLGQEETAKEYIFQSLEINKANKNLKGQAEDYILLGKLYNYSIANEYLLQAEDLANKLNDQWLKIQAQKILFSYKMMEKGVSETMGYLRAHAALQQHYQEQGPSYLDWIMGEVFLYGGMPNLALMHFKRAEPDFANSYEFTTSKNFYAELALAYEEAGNLPEAIMYYDKVMQISRLTSDLYGIKNYAQKLKELYHKQTDYKQAYYYSTLYEQYRDSVAHLARENELMLMEIENENKERQQQTMLARQSQMVRFNLQYMAMTFIIGATFIFLILLGMFKVSRTTIRIVAFFSFIFFFEFIILLMDTPIHRWTHGEPWKIWLLKIGILSFLFPLHHYLEEKLIHYLLSRKLLELRERFSVRKFIAEQRKPKTTAVMQPEHKPLFQQENKLLHPEEQLMSN